MKTFLLLPVFAVLAAAQPVGAGIKLGTTLTDALSSNIPGYASNHNFIAGPYLEVRLPKGFAMEGEALYESSVFPSIITGGASWQFPVLMKYKFGKGFVRPYVEGGPTFSHITDLADIPQLNHRSNFGVVFGGGLEIHALFLRITPEVRYNGFALRNVQAPDGTFQSNRNQAAFLVGFGF